MNARVDALEARGQPVVHTLPAAPFAGAQRKHFAAAVLLPTLLMRALPLQTGWPLLHSPLAAPALAQGMWFLVGAPGVSVGLHRHYSHRAFEAAPLLRAVLGVWGAMAAQGNLVYWVALHRMHHAASDQPGDPHSPQPQAWPGAPLPGLRGAGGGAASRCGRGPAAAQPRLAGRRRLWCLLGGCGAHRAGPPRHLGHQQLLPLRRQATTRQRRPQWQRGRRGPGFLGRKLAQPPPCPAHGGAFWARLAAARYWLVAGVWFGEAGVGTAAVRTGLWRPSAALTCALHGSSTTST